MSPSDIYAYIRLASIIKTNHTRLPEALQLCHAALEKLPNDFRTVRETGHVLLNMGKYEEARLYLQRAIELNPSEPNTIFLLGITESELGDLDAAEGLVRRAMGLVSQANAQLYASHLRHILQRKLGSNR